MKEKKEILPPKIVQRFLQWFCDPDLLEDVEGDLLELFNSRIESNTQGARILFAKDVLFLFRPGIIKNFHLHFNNYTMFKNYLITAMRVARKYKGHTLLNLLSLIVGVASCVLILLWVQDEMGVDQFHEKKNNTYKVWRNMHQASGEIITTGAIPQPLAEMLQNDYPEIDNVALIGWDMEQLVRKDNLVYFETGKYASPEFFDIFTFPFLKGDPQTALNDLSSIVISERMASKYFGDKWKDSGQILGQTLAIGSPKKDFKISGVFTNPGAHSSLHFDWVLPAAEYIQKNDWVKSWFNGGFGICFTLKEGAEIAPVRLKVLQAINENTNYDADERIYLQKFSESYLYGTFENGLPVGGRVQYVRIFLIVALFILVIACINFMNLSTARSSRRTKEVGVRKVLGAQKFGLGQQFFVESFLTSFIAVIIALTVVYLVLPFFNDITGKSLILDIGDFRLWTGLGIITLITGTLSGSYPAFFLPSFGIISSLKGAAKQSGNAIKFREGLVIFQFSLSIMLIIGTMIVRDQMDYILNKNLGLNKENVVYIEMSSELTGQMERYKTELLRIPEIVAVTSTSGNPISYGRSTGSANWNGKDPNEQVEINVLNVDIDFIETMDIQITKGRDFSENLTTDSANFIINEVTANIMGFENPLEQDLSIWGMTGKVIGVVKNFHMNSMYEPIAPLIIRYDPGSTFVSFIRLQGDIQGALQSIEELTANLNPGYPFVYEFLDKDFAASYRSEMTLSTIANIFAIISIFIACLGLFGLSSFSAEQRSREIGIRKVYGASVMSIVTKLSWGYTKLVIIAFILAAPLAYYFMVNWLNNFVFRTELNFIVFLIAGLATFLIGACTVGFKSWQAALANPVNTLKEL